MFAFSAVALLQQNLLMKKLAVRVRRALRLPCKKRILPGIQSAIELQESGESLALEIKFYSSKREDGDQQLAIKRGIVRDRRRQLVCFKTEPV